MENINLIDLHYTGQGFAANNRAYEFITFTSALNLIGPTNFSISNQSYPVRKNKISSSFAKESII